QAKRPYILAGHGIHISGAQDIFRKFVEKTNIPVGWTVHGMGVLDNDHPLNIGMLGMHGNYAPNIQTANCDLLIAIGMRFDDRVTGDVSKFATQAQVIHIEIDPAEIDKNVTADIGICADARMVLEKLIDLVDEGNHKDWIDSFHKLYELEEEKVIKPSLTIDSGDSNIK